MSLKHNTLWNLAGTGLPLLLGALTIPYLIRAVGVEAFGVLTLVWALIGYFSLFDFGLGRALTQQVAAVRSGGLLAQLPSLVKTGLWFTAATGVAGGLVLALLAYQLAFHWLKVSEVLQPSTYQALLIAGIGIPLTTVTTGLRGILEAYEDFKVVNLLRIGLGAANFGLPALSVMLVSTSLAWMVASLVAARAVVLVAHLWLVHRRSPAGWGSGQFEKRYLQNLVSFGAWMTISNIVSPLMVTADRFVISAVLGASMVAYYTVPYEGLIRVLLLPSALTSALFPRLAYVMTTDVIGARRLYQKCLLLTVAAMVPVCVMIAVLSKWGLTLWLGEDFAEKSWLIACILAAGVMLNGIAFVPFASIQASGDARSTALLHILQLILYIPCLFFGLKYWGVMGAAVAWAARAGFDLIALLLIENNKSKIG
jgi:O-antigen/teichoic acid export membrane protein